MQNTKILWADDEIELLKGHIRFLQEKGFTVESVSNGHDAVEAARRENFDIVFLDENMPGMSGLETLSEIKSFSPSTPIIMITKSEEEHIMEDAIGKKISDYLIKPVNPNQILLACKKILQNKKLVEQSTNTGYQQDFRKIGMMFYDNLDHKDWIEIFKKLTFWSRQMDDSEDKSMSEVLANQYSEANVNFGRFVMENYVDWVQQENPVGRPMFSPEILPNSAFLDLKEGYDSVFFILVDCMRYDQWKDFEEILSEYYYIEKERHYFSILPTATQYCRNAIFAGLYPQDIAKRFPRYWKNDEEDGGKNLHEPDLLTEFISRKKLGIKHSYHKILSNEQGNQLTDNLNNLLNNDLNVLVYNFIDMLSHSRTEVSIIRELAPSAAAYRSISKSWFEHSPLLDLLRKLAEKKNIKVVLTTDHGTTRVNRPTKIIGDRDTTTNLRYKQGKNLSYKDEKYLFTIKNPEDARLPQSTMSASYVFTTEDYFFAYPNNYNYYVKYFKDTFQHGGISMEEMIIPLVDLKPKG